MGRENEDVVHFGNYILTTGYFNLMAPLLLAGKRDLAVARSADTRRFLLPFHKFIFGKNKFEEICYKFIFQLIVDSLSVGSGIG